MMELPGWILLAQTASESGNDLGLYARFSVLHFLEFAIWGAWYVVLGNYLNAMGYARSTIGRIYGTMPLGAIISPMVLGTIADKYFNTELILALSHLIGAVLLVAMASVRRPGVFFTVALLYALVYSPTLALVNSIVFEHITVATNFPYIRVFGTIGWILAGMSLKLLLKPNQPVDNKPLLLAAGLSAVLGVYCFFLPATPPAASASALPFLDALGQLKDPRFAVFFLVSLVVAMAMSFYFAFAALFLEQKTAVEPRNVGPIMTLGQGIEIIFMLSLPWFITRFGMTPVLITGVIAWTLRFGCFATGLFPLVLLGVALHGICFDFFFAAGFIHVENLAEPAIRASAQSLYGVVVYGLGMFLGTESSGWLNQYFTRETQVPGQPVERTTDWRGFWAVPCVAMFICLIIFTAAMYMLPAA